MKRIIILEGVDGCGKSVLATELAAKLQPSILVRHGPYAGDKEVWRRYLTPMLAAYAGLAHVVMDRSWISEPIYGDAYRGGANRISVAQRRMLERVALGRGGAVVLCRVPWKLCETNFIRRKAEGGEMLDDTAQLKKVYEGYKALEMTSLFPNQRGLDVAAYYDFTQAPDVKGETRDAASVIDQIAEDGSPDNPGPGIGAWRPRRSILLVGDRPAGFGGRWHLPFVSFRRDGCSAWLAEQLEAAGVPESELYWINSTDGISGDDTEAWFVKRLKPRAIFALGEAAARWCEACNVEYAAVPHPQHHKRFKAKAPYPLIKEIQNAI